MENFCIKILCLIWTQVKENENFIENREGNKKSGRCMYSLACILISKFIHNAKFSILVMKSIQNHPSQMFVFFKFCRVSFRASSSLWLLYEPLLEWKPIIYSPYISSSSSILNPSQTALHMPCDALDKLTSVFYASVLLLMINCIITLSKWGCSHSFGKNYIVSTVANREYDLFKL